MCTSGRRALQTFDDDDDEVQSLTDLDDDDDDDDVQPLADVADVQLLADVPEGVAEGQAQSLTDLDDDDDEVQSLTDLGPPVRLVPRCGWSPAGGGPPVGVVPRWSPREAPQRLQLPLGI